MKSLNTLSTFIPEARSASAEESVINHIFSETGKAI